MKKKAKTKDNIYDKIINALGVFHDMFEPPPCSRKFTRKLRKLGYRVFKYRSQDYFCKVHPDKTREIVLEYYHKTKPLCNKSFYLECLYSKDNSDLFYFFLEEYEKYNQLFIEHQYLCDKILKCIYITKDIKWKEEYIKALTDHSISPDMWSYLYVCGALQIEEAIPVIKNKIDNNVFLHDVAVIALKKYKNQKLNFLKNEEKYYEFFPRQITYKILENGSTRFKKDKEKSTMMEFTTQIKSIQEDWKDKNENMIDFCQKYPEQTKELLLEFYEKSQLIDEKCFYLECLLSDKNTDLYPFLLKELRIWIDNKIDLYFICNSLVNAIYYSRNIKYKEEYLKILNDKKFSNYNYLIIELCGKLQIIEAIPYLLKILENEKNPYINFALKALGMYKNKNNYRNIFLKYSTSRNSYTKGIAKKILKSIDRKK